MHTFIKFVDCGSIFLFVLCLIFLHIFNINAILNELSGEKIDIIKYSDDLAEYVAEALSPAKVLDVYLEDERTCRVTVSPDQLSLAIGREGQNAKLVARLTGCKIDIKA